MWVILVLWVLLVADSTGALFLRSSGALECWYRTAFPGLAGLFPVQNGWPFVYFALAALGLLTATLTLSRQRKDREFLQTQ